MDIKRAGETGGADSQVNRGSLLTQELRHRMLMRIRKASVHAAELVRLCKQASSPRASLEAEAYYMVMSGTHLFMAESGGLWRKVREKEKAWGTKHEWNK